MAVRKRSAANDVSLLSALKDLCGEREIEPDVLYEAIEAALIFAYKKTKGAEREVVVDFNRADGNFKMYELRPIVEETEGGDTAEISLQEARKIDPHYEVGDVFRQEVSPASFGRIAAQAAKQFVVQRIREAERNVIYDEFNDKENEIVTGFVKNIEDGNIIVGVDKIEAILVPSEQIHGEHYQVGDSIKAYVAEVRKIGKGPQIFLSRTHPGFLKKLLELEVPEVQEGIIVVKSIAREAGGRAKIAVFSNDEHIEAVGTCIGPHGMRIQNIINEVSQEKIDLIQWSEDPARFVAAALSPAKPVKIAVNIQDKMSRVIVPDMQLSVAIGKEGQNARLAARLTGWKIDIKSESQAEGEPVPEGMTEIELVTKKPKNLKNKNKKNKKPKEKNNQQQNQQQNKDKKVQQPVQQEKPPQPENKLESNEKISTEQKKDSQQDG